MNLKRIAFNLKHLALNRGLLGGQSDYRRFMILGEARSGSNFLRGLLNSHPHIMAFGEIFRFYDNIGWEIPDFEKYRQTRRLVSQMQRDPITFLENEVFQKFSPTIDAVGFKMFYFHAKEDSRRIIWRHLEESNDIHIIHLKRKNSLRVLLSRKKAHITDKWTNVTGPEKDPLSIELTPSECLEQFTWAKNTRMKYDHIFRKHPGMDLVYEDLVSDREKETKRVQEFLGVSPRQLSSDTFKQAKMPLAEAILNYAPLKREFAGTEWEIFFED